MPQRRAGSLRRTSIVLALAAAGCSSSPGAAPLNDDAGGADAGAEVGADAPPACLAASACVQAPASGQACVTTVSATVHDGTGAAVAGLPVFVCGTNLCSLPQKTAADGTVQVAVCLPFAAPALKVFSDPQWGPFAALLPTGGPSYALGDVTVVALPSAGAVLAGDAGATSGTVTSAGVSLGLHAATVTFDVEHTTPDSQLFRAVAVPAASLPATLQGGVTAAWALAPLNTTIAPPADLTLPNAQGWSAGTLVDVYLDGTDPSGNPPPAPWGAWGLLGTGAVSADASSVVLTAAQGGLPEIAMVGVKLH